jgi:hypothetical protein
MKRHQFADLHCHPNLKTFGQSFSSKKEDWGRQHVWYSEPPTPFKIALNRLTGLTKFSQADFTTMARGNVRLAFMSLYPFEKGFFINGPLNGPLSARLANLITGIGFKRVRHLQTHTNYFKDLIQEYTFVANSCKSFQVEDNNWHWQFAANWPAVENVLSQDRQIAVIPTIEGAHVLNCGLTGYGRATDEAEVLGNVLALKAWAFPPFFITLAHNFNNDLCGHAPSLERLGPLVNQLANMNEGFTPLGYKVVEALLSQENGRRILLDVKHMSLRARLQYYDLLKTNYPGQVPIVVSHGGVAGKSMKTPFSSLRPKYMFMPDEINFFDEELVIIAQSDGRFALQLDSNRLASPQYIRKGIFRSSTKESVKRSAGIVWAHLQHIAEVLDKQGLFSWGTATIGSDFDGTINPLEGIWTAAYLPDLADALIGHARQYLNQGKHPLNREENKHISPEEIVERFIFGNALQFLKTYY